MKPLMLLFTLLPLAGMSQKITVNEYNQFTKQRRIGTEAVRIYAENKSVVNLAFNSSGQVISLQISGYGWGASAIDEGQKVVFLFSNDSIAGTSTSVQTSEVNASFQNTYQHSYYVNRSDINQLSQFDVVGIRKYGLLGEAYYMKVSKENAEKIKRISVLFLEELKKAKIGTPLQEINIRDVASHIGDSVRFCTKILHTRFFETATNRPTLLEVNDNFSSPLVNIIIWDQDRKNFSNAPETLYDQKDVCIAGFVESLNNVPQIVLRNRNQITLSKPIALAEIDKFIGDSVTVSGKVVTTKVVSSSPTSPIMLNIGAAYPNQLLTLVIENRDREKFNGSPENYYLNKEIRVTGRVELQMGKPQIVVQNKDQITELSSQTGTVVNQPSIAPAVNNTESAPTTAVTSSGNSREKSARFPGGQEALLKFLKNNLVWPKDELDIGEKKIVVVKFLINPDGSAANIKITQPGGTDFDKEVMRVLKLMPKWEPQISNGVPVTVSVTQPITFVRPETTGAKKSGRG